MSDTHKTKPWRVQRAQRNGKKLTRHEARKNWRDTHRVGPGETWADAEKREAEVLGPEPRGDQWWKMFPRSGFDDTNYTRRARRKAKRALREDPDNIENRRTERHSALWDHY